MRVPNHKSLIVCIAVALVFAATAPQVHGMQTKPPCDEDDLSFNCGGGNDSPPPETPDPTTGPYWGSWYIDGACDWSGFVLIRRYLRNPDGTPATSPPTDPTPWGGFVDSSGRVYQTACWDGAEAEAVVEGELVSGSELLSPPEFTRNPELVGLTGLETWLWFEGATQLPPIALAWTDPATGISHNLEGRAWIESITWDLGNGDAVSTSHAAEFDDAAGLGGSLANPAARDQRYPIRIRGRVVPDHRHRHMVRTVSGRDQRIMVRLAAGVSQLGEIRHLRLRSDPNPIGALFPSSPQP